ncbi:cell wall / vacuolar inhibitor of fructosidase 2-like [Henckelia pumila]|uniref:cell wall / vacuolar inhibitor of fructosidase 2-like n=1 Tax=Henckelia pumila TaxID=405737 RepID=UPI003C6DF935
MTKKVFLIVLVTVSISFFAQGKASNNKDMTLLESVCKRTYDYKLCISSLKSNPRSYNADIKGLARIMMGVTRSKVDEILRVMLQLGRNATDPRVPECLDNVCYPVYDESTDYIQHAVEHLQSNSLKEAITDMNYANGDEQECEKCFAKLEIKSPMTSINTQFATLCKVTEDIIRVLLK